MPRRPARAVLSLTLAAALAGQGLLAPVALAAAAAPAAEVVVGQAGAFTRIELHGAPVLRRDGDDVVARFPHGGAPDIARLHVRPPPHLLAAVARGEEIRFTPAAGSQARFGVADGVTWINFAAKLAAPAPAAAPAIAAGVEGAAPASGVVRMGARLQGAALVLSFPWRAAPAAAVFRRGPAVWVVFDAPARLDLSGAPHGLLQARGFTAVQAPGASAVRLLAPPGMAIRAEVQGATWTVTLSPQATPPAAIELVASRGRPAALEAELPGASRVVWISDPAVGDRLAVATASGPVAGVVAPRAFVEGAVLASAQGLAVQPAVDDLTVLAADGKVRIGRPRGLALSGAVVAAAPTADAGLGSPAAANLPALVDPAWARTGPGGFVARYDDLLAGASREQAGGSGAGVEARLGLARFLVGSDLAFEAIGVLDSLLKASPTQAQDAGFRGLRGAARVMAGRYRDAQADFSTAATAEDPASSLWRGYAAAELGDVQGARQAFAKGRDALAQFAPDWRARFTRADAETALAAGDLPAARLALQGVDGAPDPDDAAGLQLVRARLAEASGQAGAALALYRQAAGARSGAVAAPARLGVLRLQLAAHALTPAAAADELDSLRFLWRGDATEIEVVRELGRLDIAQGRYREALEALRSAGTRLPDLSASAGLRDDLASAFRALFVDGRADGMQPVEQLALFYDFKELTPIGADGDLLVRKLVRRLVDVDLLDQAADLLKYQVDNRLQGVAKAQVATDLAAIELLAGKPEGAIDAIEGSRTTLLPTPLTAQRRLLEARALVMLGRFEHALELVGADVSPDALEVRGEAAWKARDWAGAGRWAEARLGERWRSAAPLSPGEAALLIRTGSAFTLAHDDAALTRLRARYGALAAANPQHDALGVALAGLSGEGLSGAAPGVLARLEVGDADVLAGWITRMRGRLSEVGSLSDPAPAPPAAATLARAPARAGAPAPRRA